MFLPLRKALKLRKALEAALAKPELPLAVELAVLVEANRERPTEAVEAGARALAEAKAARVRLSGILRDLRIGIASENVAAGVDGFLARAADLDRRIALEKAVAEAAEAPGEEQLKAEIDLAFKALHATERRGYGEPARKVASSVVTAAMREAARRALADLRREREAIEDERIAANARAGIEIAAGDVELLREIGVL